MVCPPVVARVEKPGELPCIRVDPRNVRAFEPVAVRASEREIPFNRLASMFLSKDVVDLKRQRESKLGNQAVLATIASTPPDPADEFPIHCGAEFPVFLRTRRARDCITPRRLPMRR